eukprot:TRINITY_DN2249_c0_g1_i1.p1 TRINITY_DN2249_c0_g1~~TRINITY_DN2249_c0_g1_i1.p1  ORF type:complete len:84 (+),score=4.31 TRINITY_DN2249_c0_g1_i1:182-433(+)
MSVWTALFVGTGIWVVLLVLGLAWNFIPFIPPKGWKQDKWLSCVMIVTTCFCTWFMWIIVYMSQMYPLPGEAPQILIPANAMN